LVNKIGVYPSEMLLYGLECKLGMIKNGLFCHIQLNFNLKSTASISAVTEDSHHRWL